MDCFISGLNGVVLTIEWWLEPVPDRESELIEMLEEIIHQNEFRGYGESMDAIKAKKLIQSVKQPK